jgi:hypothetical protein
MAQLKTLPAMMPREMQEQADKSSKGEDPTTEPRTEPKPEDREHDTERLSYGQVRLNKHQPERLAENLDWTSPFSFERERIQALKMTELYGNLHCSSEKSLVGLPPAREESFNIYANGRVNDPSSACTQRWNAIVHVQKLVSMMGVLYGVVCLLGWFFALSYISITSLPVTTFLSWLSEEFVTAGLLIYLCARGYYVVNYTLAQVNCHIILLVCNLLMLVSFLLVIIICRGLTDTLRCAQQWSNEGNSADENVEAMLCIVLLTLFFSTLVKVLLVFGYIFLAFCFRRALSQRLQSPAPTSTPL